jgi:hypothetical protein
MTYNTTLKNLLGPLVDKIVYWNALFLSSFLLQDSDHLEGMFQIPYHCNIL